MTGQYSVLSSTHDIDIKHYVELARAERDAHLKSMATALVKKVKGLCRSGFQVTVSKLSPGQ